MFIVYGTKSTQKILAYTQAYTCPRCNNGNPFGVLRVIKWFTLFWIPLIPYSFKYFMVCPVCQQMHPMDKEQAKQLAAQAKAMQAPQ